MLVFTAATTHRFHSILSHDTTPAPSSVGPGSYEPVLSCGCVSPKQRHAGRTLSTPQQSVRKWTISNNQKITTRARQRGFFAINYNSIATSSRGRSNQEHYDNKNHNISDNQSNNRDLVLPLLLLLQQQPFGLPVSVAYNDKYLLPSRWIVIKDRGTPTIANIGSCHQFRTTTNNRQFMPVHKWVRIRLAPAYSNTRTELGLARLRSVWTTGDNDILTNDFRHQVVVSCMCLLLRLCSEVYKCFDL